MSASAFSAAVAGYPGDGGMVDQTADPRLTTGFCGLSGRGDITAAALAALGNVPFSASAAGVAGCCPFCARSIGLTAAHSPREQSSCPPVSG